MAYKNLQPGSSGEDVKKLQMALGFTGSDVDGIYGGNTEGAVMRYQMQHGLAETGVADENMLNHLYSNQKTTTSPSTTVKPESNVPTVNKPTTPPPTTNTTASGYTYNAFAPSDETNAAGQRKEEILSQKPGDFTYDPYAKSDIVLQADALLQQWIDGKPGEYKPVWHDEADAYLSQYQNRDPFSYDFNADALYNQYKDQYIQQGRMAMMDTMGQAAALTGGYGNSYAQTVGQQAYNQQLGQLNNIMPELYGMAYDRYNQEGQDLLNMYGIYMDREAQEYGKYQDNLNNWYTHLDFLQKDAQYKSEDDYSKWLDQTNMDYKQWQDGYNSWLDEFNQADEDYWNLYGRDYNAWSDKTGDNADTVFDHVSSTSMGDIIDRLYSYNKKGDNRNMEAYLDGLVAEGRISQDLADSLYDQYRTQKDDEGPIDTTVDPLKRKYGASGRGVGQYGVRRDLR